MKRLLKSDKVNTIPPHTKQIVHVGKSLYFAPFSFHPLSTLNAVSQFLLENLFKHTGYCNTEQAHGNMNT